MLLFQQVFNVEATGQYRKLFKLYALPGTGNGEIDSTIYDQKVDVREVCEPRKNGFERRRDVKDSKMIPWDTILCPSVPGNTTKSLITPFGADAKRRVYRVPPRIEPGFPETDSTGVVKCCTHAPRRTWPFVCVRSA